MVNRYSTVRLAVLCFLYYCTSPCSSLAITATKEYCLLYCMSVSQPSSRNSEAHTVASIPSKSVIKIGCNFPPILGWGSPQILTQVLLSILGFFLLEGESFVKDIHWTRGCSRWGAARCGAVLAVEYVRAFLGVSRSVCSCGRGHETEV